LTQYSPMTADGAGRLLLLESAGDGYGILARQSQTSEAFDMIYRRKGAWASSLAVGPDGTFCVGLNSGIDCVDAQGIVTHLDHDLLSNVISIAFTPTGDLWALTSKSGGATGLQLVYVTRDVSSRTFSGTKRVLTMRQDVRRCIGHGLAAPVDGSVIV